MAARLANTGIRSTIIRSQHHTPSRIFTSSIIATTTRPCTKTNNHNIAFLAMRTQLYSSRTSHKPNPFKTDAASIASSKNSKESRESLITASSKSLRQVQGKTGPSNYTRQLADLCAKQDVIMYQPPETLKKTFTLAYATAILQLLFWGNIAQYAFTHYNDDPIFQAIPPPIPEGEVAPEPSPLAPLRKRIIISLGLVGTGLVIAFGVCAIPWRYVTKLTLLQGGTTVRIHTGRTIPKGYYREYPIQEMQSRQQLVTGVGPEGRSPAKEGGSTHLLLGSSKERMAFFVDRRGQFVNAKLWDAVFHKPY